MKGRLVFAAALILFLPMAAAAPALELFDGDLDMRGNALLDVGALNVNNPLTDGNVSDTISISGGFVSVSDPLTAGNITDAYVRNTGDTVSGDLNVTGTLNMSGSRIVSISGVGGTNFQSGGALDLANNNLVDAGTVQANKLQDPDDGNIQLGGGDNLDMADGNLRKTNTVETNTIKNDESGTLTVDDAIDMGQSTDKNINDVNRLDVNRVTDSEDTLLQLQDNVAIEGHLNMSNDHINNVRALDMNNPLTDGNISDSITVNLLGSVNKSDLTDAGTLSYDWADSEVSDSLTVNLLSAVNKSDLTNAGTLSFDWTDSEVSDSLTVNLLGSVNKSDLTNAGTLSYVWSDGEVSESLTLDLLGAVNKSDLAGTGTLSFDWTDAEVSDSLTVNLLGAVNKSDLADAGTLSYDWADSEVADTITIDGGFVNPGTQLDAGNVSDVWVNESGDTMTGNLDMNTNNITRTELFNMTDHGGNLPACDGGHAGAIMYNGSHWGCDGTAWNPLY